MTKTKIIASLIILFIFPISVYAEESTQPNPYFDNIKVNLDRDYVLNDAIEFALFDMSEVKFINETKKVEIQNKKINILKDAQSELKNIPKLFYQNLKSQIHTQKIPITLYSDTSPSYTKPIELYIKIKRIELKPNQIINETTYRQPVMMRIYGQLKDKATDEILVKFYDSYENSYDVAQAEINTAYESISHKLMQDLASYLKTKY